MEDTYKEGDYILVNRLTDLNKIINENIVFKLDDIYYVKRVVFDKGTVLDYNQLMKSCENISTVKKYYRIYFNNLSSINSWLKLNEISDSNYGTQRTTKYLKIQLNNEYFKKISKQAFVDSIHLINFDRIFKDDEGKYMEILENHSLIVPYLGFRVTPEDPAYNLYKESYTKFENLAKDKLNDTTLTFNSDYVFLLGDNRIVSKDSRNYGFISKKNIIGKVIYKF